MANIDNGKLKALKAGFAQVAKDFNIDLQFLADNYLSASKQEREHLTAYLHITEVAIRKNDQLQDLGELKPLYAKMAFLSFSSESKALAESV